MNNKNIDSQSESILL